jgi:hypothetical protein
VVGLDKPPVTGTDISQFTSVDLTTSIGDDTAVKVCRTGISTWWVAIFDNMVRNGECESPGVGSFDRNREKSSELRYLGGSVLQPKKGLYHDLTVVDVASLYPTMAILHNLSFDIINCECCKDDLQCRIPNEITKDCKIEKKYWVCRRKEVGAFPKKLKIFKEERLKQKKLGNQVKPPSQGISIISKKKSARIQKITASIISKYTETTCWDWMR